MKNVCEYVFKKMKLVFSIIEDCYNTQHSVHGTCVLAKLL